MLGPVNVPRQTDRPISLIKLLARGIGIGIGIHIATEGGHVLTVNTHAYTNYSASYNQQ